MEELKLYMIMLGCKPRGRLTEQHDIFFGIGPSLKALVPQMHKFWPEADGELHIDAWREVTNVDRYQISIATKTTEPSARKLFFINLGGYKKGEFEEYHYKILTVADTMSEATKTAKATAFYSHYNFKGATSHVDDKYGIDVDDLYNINELMEAEFKSAYRLQLTPAPEAAPDQLHIGYLKLSKL